MCMLVVQVLGRLRGVPSRVSLCLSRVTSALNWVKT